MITLAQKAQAIGADGHRILNIVGEFPPGGDGAQDRRGVGPGLHGTGYQP